MLIVIFGISFFFARRALQPIVNSWNRQNQFIADASHEFKTPIAIIQANADVLLANQEDTIANQKKWIDHIQYETKRMNLLVGGFARLAQAEDESICI